ncbi:MAG: acetyl-CoA C-acetyltransferase [Gammaproteobacteria bacterium]
MQSVSTSRDRLVYIVDGLRTPFLKAKGQPGDFSAADLAVGAARPLLATQPFNPTDLNEVIVGCVSPSEEEANIARIIALRLGCGHQVPAFTVQRNCASGLQAIDSAYQNILLGKSDLVLAGGTEAMSRTPLLYSRAMTMWFAQLSMAKNIPSKLKALIKFRPQFLVPVIALLKGLTDPVVNLNMGQTAEEIAYRYKISRLEMDQYATQSHLRAERAYQSSEMDEVTALYDKKGGVYLKDDGIRPDSSPEKLAKLKPVFEKFGTITAGNSSQITDGAAFVILASSDAVKQYGLKPLAVIRDIHWAALDPAIMGLGPVHAITPLLKKHGLGFSDLDQVEINEAFAAQILGCLKAWESDEFKLGKLPSEILNPNGGAIAMGHPVGASGARLVLHCAKSLARNKNERAVASLCIGGGQGGAILIERVEGVV